MIHMIQNAKDQVLALTNTAYQTAAAQGKLPGDVQVRANVEIPKDPGQRRLHHHLRPGRRQGHETQPPGDRRRAGGEHGPCGQLLSTPWRSPGQGS